MSSKTVITLSSLPAKLNAATTRSALIRLANQSLSEAERSLKYAQHCDLDDAVLAVGESAKYGAFAVEAITRAKRL